MVTMQADQERYEIVAELLDGALTQDEVCHKWRISPLKAAELKALGFGFGAAVSDARNEDGGSPDGPVEGTGSNPLENLGGEAQREWAAALLAAYSRLQEPDDSPEPTDAAY